MLFRPILIAAVLATAPMTAFAQTTETCDPATTTCPDDASSTAGVNVDP